MKIYINLIDFQAAIEYKNKDNPDENIIINSHELCAPELINKLVYDYNSDYYRLGSMLYFIIFREYPNIIRSKKNITDGKIHFNKIKGYSLDCLDFINQLIITDPKKRIGLNDINELKNHSYFKHFTLTALFKRDIKSPFPYIPRQRSLCQKMENFTKKYLLIIIL